MPHKPARSKFSNWYLTPAEISVLASAIFTIWLAKAQDRAVAGANFSAENPKKRESSFGVYLPSFKAEPVALPEKPLETMAENPAVETDLPINSAPAFTDLAEKDKFLREFAVRQKFKSGKLNEAQWAALLKNAGVTFAGVEEIFQNATGKTSGEALPGEALKNPAMLTKVGAEIEKRFGIPSSETAFFAKNGKKLLSEWAIFVEDRQR